MSTLTLSGEIQEIRWTTFPKSLVTSVSLLPKTLKVHFVTSNPFC
jgi:hypothetical protein